MKRCTLSAVGADSDHTPSLISSAARGAVAVLSVILSARMKRHGGMIQGTPMGGWRESPTPFKTTDSFNRRSETAAVFRPRKEQIAENIGLFARKNYFRKSLKFFYFPLAVYAE